MQGLFGFRIFADKRKFGAFVAQLRKEKGYTQKELSEKTGIAQSDISKLENGNSNPTLGMLKRLAEGMDMTIKLEFVPKRVN